VKGVDRSLRAIAALNAPQVHYLLVGADKAAPFRRLARRLGIAKQVSIVQGRSDVPALLAAADLLLHPAYRESAGYTLLEAVVAGLPVLTTQTCGYAFHVQQAGAGVVCDEPFSQEQLNTHLASMLAQLSEQEWSTNGLRYGQNDELYSMPEAAAEAITRAAGKTVEP
jgi:UDP-glucose:(heptosyl)LPS alpha-1,3-glucosyltransferase